MFFNHIDGNYKGVYYADVLTDGRYWDGKVKGKQVYKAEFFWNKNNLKQI